MTPTTTATTDPAAPLILIVDDDEAMRNSMAFLFASIGLSAQSFPDAASFLAALPPEGELRPGALILDVRMPGMSGLELQRLLNERGFPLPILIVTGHGDVPMAVQALKGGAYDFIEKPFKEQYLLDMVGSAIRVCTDTMARRHRERSIAERLARLGRREREVLDGVLAGKLNKVIAYELELSVKTVEAYRASIMIKMEAGSLAELARMLAKAE
jgi:two-component system, LuxR family, response regulator FixJ